MVAVVGACLQAMARVLAANFPNRLEAGSFITGHEII
jgi:hypothetical protein